jgi:uncharacterized protein DUF397
LDALAEEPAGGSEEVLMLNEAWRTSTRSQDTNCVEVAYRGGEVLVRDTKNREAALVSVTPEGWRSFVAGIKAGEFDLG